MDHAPRGRTKTPKLNKNTGAQVGSRAVAAAACEVTENWREGMKNEATKEPMSQSTRGRQGRRSGEKVRLEALSVKKRAAPVLQARTRRESMQSGIESAQRH